MKNLGPNRREVVSELGCALLFLATALGYGGTAYCLITVATSSYAGVGIAMLAALVFVITLLAIAGVGFQITLILDLLTREPKTFSSALPEAKTRVPAKHYYLLGGFVLSSALLVFGAVLMQKMVARALVAAVVYEDSFVWIGSAVTAAVFIFLSFVQIPCIIVSVYREVRSHRYSHPVGQFGERS